MKVNKGIHYKNKHPQTMLCVHHQPDGLVLTYHTLPLFLSITQRSLVIRQASFHMLDVYFVGIRIFVEDVEKTQWFESASIDDAITGIEVSLLKSKTNAVDLTFSSGR